MLRTCTADMTAHGGFCWPESGYVEAPDWDPSPVCGGGLHGLLHGEGDGTLLSWEPGARWLVVEVDARHAVDLDGKAKAPRAWVVHCGDRLSATADLAERCPGRAIVGGTATAGDRGTATAGGYGTATAGDRGTATAGVGGEIRIRWWDGSRYRLAVGYVGEGGIRPGVPYRCDAAGRLVEVTP